MRIFKSADDIQRLIKNLRSGGKTIGFVPTMGALHEGHKSLINYSVIENDFTAASIFVNPRQFNNKADFEKYPVSLEEDIRMLEYNQCDLLFLPSVEEVYPNGNSDNTNYDLGFLESVYEGKYRPGHFQGVCQVVHRLLNIMKPDVMYLGQKDFQQCMVIKKLLQLTGKDKEVALRICPTLRETNGLAMSSRNRRLSPEERKKAKAIYKALLFLKENLTSEPIPDLLEKASAQLTEAGFQIDYLDIAFTESLNEARNWNGKVKLVALAAASLNEVRLIDNMLLN